MAFVIMTHVGAGSTQKVADLAEKAGEVGFDVLRKGGSALDAVEEAIVFMEDDERTNAGLGSRLRLNGKIQMDASLMDSYRNCGAVAAIENVKNPIRVARKVMDTPHIVLAAEGAIEYARSKGFEHFDPKTERTVEILEKVKKKITDKDVPAWASKWKDYEIKDTVGAVAMDSEGRFATGNSTGGTSYMMEGRIGDTPVIGAGLYAGEKGAVTATGIGEEIVRYVQSKWVYDRIEEGQSPQDACDASLNFFEDHIPIGVLAVSRAGTGVSCNTDMAWWAGEG
jgi:isoaspartyl peptidase/L-asparaginase-like protein (Ntn-hydrolase superfamily)